MPRSFRPILARFAFAVAFAVAFASPFVFPAAARAQGTRTAPVPARLTTRDLARLRWIVGDWRGVGVDGTKQPAFYERYRFADDSTLLVESFDDSTWTRASETTRYQLRGGRFANAGTGAQWVAIAIDSVGVDFAPVARARNGFRSSRSAGTGPRPREWRATITWPHAFGAGQDRFYRMQRVR